MGAAYFYHLTRRPLEHVLPPLLDKAGQAGWRTVIRGREEGQIAFLDNQLWLVPEDGFLPHGRDGTGHDAEQPILLTTRTDLPPGINCLMVVGGADVGVQEIAALDRVCILFDGGDGAALAHARDQWKTLTAAGVAAQYWSEESGRWEKKAESA